MRITLVMLDQNYSGMQQAFLNYSIELSKRGFPVLPVVRNESVVENKLREAGISSIAISSTIGLVFTTRLQSVKSAKRWMNSFIVPRPISYSLSGAGTLCLRTADIPHSGLIHDHCGQHEIPVLFIFSEIFVGCPVTN